MRILGSLSARDQAREHNNTFAPCITVLAVSHILCVIATIVKRLNQKMTIKSFSKLAMILCLFASITFNVAPFVIQHKVNY